jgi:hypothetical protein
MASAKPCFLFLVDDAPIAGCFQPIRKFDALRRHQLAEIFAIKVDDTARYSDFEELLERWLAEILIEFCAECILVVEKHALHAFELVDPPFVALRRIGEKMLSLHIEQRLKSVRHDKTPGATTPLGSAETKAEKTDAAGDWPRPHRGSLRGVAAVDEDGLAGHPPAVREHKADVGNDIFDIGQSGLGELRQGCRGLMIFLRILALDGIEERRVHGAGTDRDHRDAALAELLRCRPREVLYRRLGAGISGIERRERTEQGGDQGADLAVVVEMLAGFLEKKEG